MKFIAVSKKLPPPNIAVLVRGWGERQTFYMYDFAQLNKTMSGGFRWWDYRNDEELWFEPVAWAELEQPKNADA